MSIQLLCTNYGSLYDALKVVRHCRDIMKGRINFDKITVLHPDPFAVQDISVEKAYSRNQNECLVKEVPYYIKCDHVISVHWDGFIIRPDLWDERWLQYDWIGCPWGFANLPNLKWRVGSGGFMMFSKRISEMWEKFCNIEENFDWQIGALYRYKFEWNGMKYGTLEDAAKFGKEMDLEDFPIEEGETFGFHGFGDNPGFNISEEAKEHRKKYRENIYGIMQSTEEIKNIQT